MYFEIGNIKKWIDIVFKKSFCFTIVYDQNGKNWFRPNTKYLPYLIWRKNSWNWILQLDLQFHLPLIWQKTRQIEYRNLICIWFDGKLIKLNTETWFAFDLREKWIKITLTHCGNYGNFLSRIFGKNFVKLTFLLNKLVAKGLIWRNIYLVRENFTFFHTVPQWKKISSNELFK